MKLKKPKISTKSLLISFGFACLALIVAGWFYWFEWRPYQARKHCFEETKQIKSKSLTVEQLERFYQVCLAMQGLESESLLK